MADPQEGTPSGIVFLVGRPPLDRAAALHRRRLVRRVPARSHADHHIAANDPGKSKDGNQRRLREGVQAETKTVPE